MVEISRKEWVRVIGFAVFVVALTTLPYLLAWSAQTPDRAFSGALFGVEDANSYLAKMRIGVRGEWAFSLFYTPERTDTAPLIFLPYIAVGQFIRLVVNDPVYIPAALMIAYQVMRVICDVLLVLAIYRFVAQFVAHERVRYNAMALACLAGGLGWLTVIFPIQSAAMPDLTIPEGFGFLVLYGLPHLALGRAAMLVGLVCLIPQFSATSPLPNRRDGILAVRFWRTRRSASLQNVLLGGEGKVILAGLLFNLVGLCVPFYLAVIYVILGVWGIAAWIMQRRFPTGLFWRALIAAGMTLPLFAYNALIFTQNPAFAQWSAQNILTSPPMWEYVLAYAPMVLFAALAIRYFARRARTRIEDALLIGWIAATPVLVYLPLNVQRRLSEGVIVPLAILAAWGIRQWVWADQLEQPSSPSTRRDGILAVRFWRTRRSASLQNTTSRHDSKGRRTITTLAIITFLCATSILWVATGALATLLKNDPTYISGEQMRALAWLQANAEPDDRVIGAWETGNMLPVYTDLRPIMGLGPETLDADAKKALVLDFYRDQLSDDEREALYNLPCTTRWTSQPEPPPNCRVRYVVWGANERELLLHLSDVPASFDWQSELTLVYEDGSTRIYEVPN